MISVNASRSIAEIFKPTEKQARFRRSLGQYVFVDHSLRIPRNVLAFDVNRLVSEFASRSSSDHDTFMIVWRRFEFYAMHFVTDQTGYLRRKLYDEIYANFWKYIIAEDNLLMKLGSWYAIHAFFFTQPQSIQYKTIMIRKDGWNALEKYILCDDFPFAKRILSELAPYLVVVTAYPELEEHLVNYRHNFTPPFLQTRRQAHGLLQKQFSEIEFNHLSNMFHIINRDDKLCQLESYERNSLLQYDQIRRTLHMDEENSELSPGMAVRELEKTSEEMSSLYQETQRKLTSTDSSDIADEESQASYIFEDGYIVATNSVSPNDSSESRSPNTASSTSRGHMPSFSLQSL